MKKLIGGLVLLCVCGILSWIAGEKIGYWSSRKTVVKIGATLPLSGKNAEIGLTAKKALKMAVEKWNKRNSKYKYKLVIEDDKGEVKNAVANAKNLIRSKKINAIITQGREFGLAVTPVVNDAKIVHFTCSSGDKITKGRYNFSHYTSYKKQADALIGEFKKKNVKSVSYVIVDNDRCQEQSKFVIGEIKKNSDIEVKDINYYEPDKRDFSLMIGSLELEKPDQYLICGEAPSLQLFVSQLRKEGKNVAAIDPFGETGKADLEAMDGFWFVSPALGTEKFGRLFKGATGLEPTSCAANVYDAAELIIYAYENTYLGEQSEVPRIEDLLTTLYAIKKYQGATGAVGIDPDGRVDSEALVKVVKDGKVVELGK